MAGVDFIDVIYFKINDMLICTTSSVYSVFELRTYMFYEFSDFPDKNFEKTLYESCRVICTDTINFIDVQISNRNISEKLYISKQY